ncbi:unnamed protein product [Lactuca saligna]|uniref:Uncharacterized protein n=1 Tax=Lactuca saligna TaxID=75948 RepID=A0AA35Z3K1_LACSI|nr:unnamed protein product [Lactuca saligna]
MRPIAMALAVAPRMPMYPPGGPGLGQQIFYGQAQPTFIPPQPGFGYQQQLVLGMRPGGAPMPNFFMPMVQQGQKFQHPGGRHATGLGQQNHQPIPLMQQQPPPCDSPSVAPPSPHFSDQLWDARQLPLATNTLSSGYQRRRKLLLRCDSVIKVGDPLLHHYHLVSFILRSPSQLPLPLCSFFDQSSHRAVELLPSSKCSRRYDCRPPSTVADAFSSHLSLLVLFHSNKPFLQCPDRDGRKSSNHHGSQPWWFPPWMSTSATTGHREVVAVCVQYGVVPDGSMIGTGGGGMVSVPYDMGGMALRDTRITQPISIGALASALANASPTKQIRVYAAVVKHLETVAGANLSFYLLVD